VSSIDLATKVGRLQRKVARALKQRDHWKAQHDQLRDVLDKFPWIEKRHTDYTKGIVERERVRGLEQRIKEQAALIERLTQEQKP
jgi:hypothetical protein